MRKNKIVITDILPRGLTVRPSTLDDLASLTEIIRLNEVKLDGTAETTLEEMRIVWQVPGFDPAVDSWVVLSPEGELIGCAAASDREHVHIEVDIAVHPDYRNKGIEAYLLDIAEVRAREHISLAEPGARVTLSVGQNSRDTTMPLLLEQRGFKLTRHFWRMGIELKAISPEPQWPEGITVRTMESGMERIIHEIDQEIFQDHWGYLPEPFEEWELWTTKRESFDPSLWFLAMDGEQIAGLDLCQYEEQTGGWVHTLGIRRQWRRKGLGLALLHHSFREFYRRGIYNVYLGVDSQNLTGATRLYERADMHVVRQYNNYEKELRAGRELSTQSL